MGSIDKMMNEEDAKTRLREAENELPKDRPYRVQHVVLNKWACKQLNKDASKTDGAAGKGNAPHSRYDVLIEELSNLAAKENYVVMENKKVWFSCEKSILFPCIGLLPIQRFKELLTEKGNLCAKSYFVWEGFTFKFCLKPEDISNIFYVDQNSPYHRTPTRVFFSGKYWAYGIIEKNDSFDGWLEMPALYMRDENINEREPAGQIAYYWLKYGLVPRGLSEKAKELYRRVLRSWQAIGSNFKVIDGKLRYGVARKQAAPAQENVPKPESDLDILKKSLLNCDYWRANIQPYNISTLTDINGGHWELAEPCTTVEGKQMDLPDDVNLFARPPQLDVIGNAVCAIDFGTRSTVVVRRKDNRAKLMRVGMGDYSQKASIEHYENPTVVHFKDLDSFMEAYAAREGRPFTEWNQVTVSHMAADLLKNLSEVMNAEKANAIFGELKQWANDRHGQLNLRDGKKKLFTLKPYAELAVDDMDPIEIYAYYLGLYINNMTQKICLHYLLSYPVTYAKDVRERIRRSFERGLKKSLPPAILRDEAVMRRFKVEASADEAIAYALSALETNHLEPQEKGDMVSYAVFDFGGGTTDYAFGVERCLKGRFRYEITEYGSGGDSTLGGENLLHLIAYEVYRENLPVMREKNIPFVLPPKSEMPAGTEILLKEAGDASLEARMNTRILIEVLRPFWERSAQEEDESKKFFDESPSVILYPSGGNGGNGQNIDLKINEDTLIGILKRRIQEGVDNFFVKLEMSFQEKEKTLPIYVFLAGNSCKSKLLQDIMKEAVARYEADCSNESGKAAEGNIIKLCNPLAETDADIPSDERRTGKTGVAFGLLRTLPRFGDVRIKSKEKEADFSYYLGYDMGGKLKVCGPESDYGEWFEFTYVNGDSFEITYTREAQALNNEMSIVGLPSIPCYLEDDELDDAMEDDVKVFLCKKNPDTICWSLGRAQDFENGNLPHAVHELQLK